MAPSSIDPTRPDATQALTQFATDDLADAPRAWWAIAVNEPARALFQLDAVEVTRGDKRILGPIDLAMPATGPVVIAGPSGSGKSSLLRLLNRLDVPTQGTVRYHGEAVATVDPTEHRRRVAMVFQRPVVLPGTVTDNLLEADPALSPEKVAEMLGQVGLDPGVARQQARDLSGGEAQRMCLARSLATEPDVVLFDESTSSLDPANAARIEGLAATLEQRGITVIWVTHDLDQLRRVARWVVFLADGLVLQAGPAAEVLAQPVAAVADFLAAGTP